MKRKFSTLLLCTVALFCVGCGGGSDSGTLLTGTLTEAGGADTTHRFLRHSDGEKIDGVTICALGKCSTTDEEGEWGFVVDTGTLTEVLLDLEGHGIDTETVVPITPGAQTISITLNHVAGGKIEHPSVIIDGVELHDHGDHDESSNEEHSHDHSEEAHESHE